MYKKFIFTLILILLVISHINAQEGISLGLGGAYTALARGPEAIFWNPANLALSSRLPNFNLKFYSISFAAGNNAFDLNFYNTYFTGTGQTDIDGNDIGKTLTESDKNDILNRIPDSGLELLGRGDFSFLAFNYKNFGFSIEGNAHMKASLPKDAFEMVLTEIGQKSYSFNIDGDGFGAARVNLSYAVNVLKNSQKKIFNKKINELALGGTVSYIRGLVYAGVTESDINVNITNTGFNAPSRVVAKMAEGGSGFGLDLGLGAVLENGWQLGLALDNIPAVISWSTEAKDSVFTFDLERNRFIDEFSDIDIDEYKESYSNNLSSISQTLPLNVRLGIAKYYKSCLLNVEMAREYGSFRFTLGGGLDLKILELYAAYGRANSDNYFSSALAFNFKHFLFDIGVMNRGGITGNSSKAFSLASSLRIGF